MIRQEIHRLENEEAMRNARILADIKIREHEEELAVARRTQAECELAEVLTGLQVTHGTLLGIEESLRKNLSWLAPEQTERVLEALRAALDDPKAGEAVDRVASEAEALTALHDVDEGFFEALDGRWPGLTRKQRQLCVMIRADLQTSQIAQLLGISHESVWTQRKRLRRRLALAREVKLEDVLADL